MTKQILTNRKVAVLLESEYIPEEITAYQNRFAELGAEVHFMSRLWGKDEITFYSDAIDEPSRIARQFTVSRDIATARPSDYDAVIMAANYTSVRLRYFDVPSGEKPSRRLAATAPAVQFFSDAMLDSTIIKGALCHGLWILTPRPDLLKDREVICHEVVLADIVNAGAKYVAAPTGVHVDNDLVTGRSKDEVYSFIDTIAQLIVDGSSRHGRCRSSCSGSKCDALDNAAELILQSLSRRFAQAANNFSANRPVARAAGDLLDDKLDVPAEIERLIGIKYDVSKAKTHKPLLLVASKFGVWSSEVSLVAATLMRLGYSITVATEDGSPPHFLAPSLDPSFEDGAWRVSVVSDEEQRLAYRFLDPSRPEHILLDRSNIMDLSKLARPPQVGDYLKDNNLLKIYAITLRETLGVAEKFDGIIVAGGSGAVPGLMADRGLQSLILAFHVLRKPIMGECNGGLALAQTVDPATGSSILAGRAVTTHSWLDEYQSGWGWTEPFDRDPASFWRHGAFDLKAYAESEKWVSPGISGNPIVDSEALFKNAAGPRGVFFSPPGTPYSVVADDNIITCRTTPDGYPGALALAAYLDGDPPLRGRLFIHTDELGSRSPAGTTKS